MSKRAAEGEKEEEDEDESPQHKRQRRIGEAFARDNFDFEALPAELQNAILEALGGPSDVEAAYTRAHVRETARRYAYPSVEELPVLAADTQDQIPLLKAYMYALKRDNLDMVERISRRVQAGRHRLDNDFILAHGIGRIDRPEMLLVEALARRLLAPNHQVSVLATETDNKKAAAIWIAMLEGMLEHMGRAGNLERFRTFFDHFPNAFSVTYPDRTLVEAAARLGNFSVLVMFATLPPRLERQPVRTTFTMTLADTPEKVVATYAARAAAEAGQLDVLKWILATGRYRYRQIIWLVDECCLGAATTDQRAVLEWVETTLIQGALPSTVYMTAAAAGHLDLMQWLLDVRRVPLPPSGIFISIRPATPVAVLDWFAARGILPNRYTGIAATLCQNAPVLAWLRAHGVPLDAA